MRLLTGTSCNPARWNALASISSLYSVAVPCADTKPMSSGSSWLRRIAAVSAEASSAPVLDGPEI
ncbi:hypothetical protein WJU16_19425 [Chitinophaga pollutisoli]|uniref:Uncharacterized protein n=1 Tax=Chitinophaga pollutisoli TaxID=3133966 RepID=A0ABZ2YK75_9BACT